MKTKVTTRGQVSIPAEIRKKLHIETDTKLEWCIEGNAIRVVPVPKDPISAFRGKGKGVYTTQDLLKERTQERSLEDERDKRS
jgi:AbrB family looped-hinge helix DNA binding protein